VRKLLGGAVLGLLLAVAGGCGDDKEAPSKSEYVKRADAICAKGDRKLEREIRKAFPTGRPNPKEIADFGREHAIPEVEGQLRQLRKLPAPEGDEDKTKAIFSEAGKALEKAKANPALLASGDPFMKANKMARAYGLKACGS
jgi:hypothetical protein